MTFGELRAANVRRCETAFHSVSAWKPWEWSNALAGEIGETCAEGFALLTALAAVGGKACNVTKKMNRIWPANQFKENWNKPEDQRMADLEDRLADEIADVVIYADLLAARIGRSLDDCVRQKFNSKSDEIGSAVKLQ
jgi:NTP pyrophosphatase (non-canonical NTP hydrolase)